MNYEFQFPIISVNDSDPNVKLLKLTLKNEFVKN